MEELFTKACLVCKKNEDEATLNKCPVCFRYYCTDHAHLMAGREFCSQGCARYMFSPDDDEE